MKWQIEEAGPKSPSWNMEEDSRQLDAVINPVLRFYEWNAPSVTYGYFVDPWEHFDQKGVEQEGLILARRPTGGGIIFHLDDLAFSITVPANHPFYALNSLHSYHMINSLVLEAIQKSVPCNLLLPNPAQETPRGGFCMEKATKYDILLDGKKVGGAAQRKTKLGLLHQVSLCLKLPDPKMLSRVLKQGDAVYSGITNASAGLGIHLKPALKRHISEAITQIF